MLYTNLLTLNLNLSLFELLLVKEKFVSLFDLDIQILNP